MKPICFSLLIFLTSGQRGHPRGSLPYNPLESLDWTNLILNDQIQDNFVANCQYCNTTEATTYPAIIIDDIEFRRFDGIGNNIKSPHWATTNSRVPRCLPAEYGDGFNSLNGQTRKNPREISNVISKQIPEESDKFVNNRFLTQFVWQWGQFIDHDITLISEDKSALDLDDDIDIYIPCGDPAFDSTDTCDADKLMELFRTKSFGTGTGKINPFTGEKDIRQQFNEITGFIDGSMIYGSDLSRANALRNFTDGMLKEDELGFLPKNNESNPILNEPNEESKFFIGGDVRVNEQLGLLTMHTIWVRAHNIIAERVGESIDAQIVGGVSLSDTERDEKIFQYTRVIIIAIIQKIVYKDWLPTLFGPTAMARFLPQYVGYDNTTNPGICPIFASAAYRLGHTFLPENLPLREADCSDWTGYDAAVCPACANGGIQLRNAFFDPDIAEHQDGFFEALLNGFACTLANEVDTAVTGGVRNFLFFSARNDAGDRLFGDLDLISINLQRGREHGLPDYNKVRKEMELGAYTNFSEITSNGNLSENLEVIYDGDINNIDLFLGLLAEDHFPDGSFGEAISSVVLGQFARLRDGDRFFYQNYIKPGELMDFIECISLKTIIEWTTDITNIDAIDSIRHNIFQNKRAISIFADRTKFKAQAVDNPMDDINNNINDNKWVNNDNEWNDDYNDRDNKWYGNNYNNYQPQQPQEYVIELNNFQIFLCLVSIIMLIGCSCYTLHQCNKNKKIKYHAVQYDTEADIDASDIQILQS